MGSLITKEKREVLPLDQHVSVCATVKEEQREHGGVQRDRNGAKRDGRTYKEVLRGGVEKGSMSELRKQAPPWEFCEAPENGKVQVQEPVQDSSRDREGTGALRSV